MQMFPEMFHNLNINVSEMCTEFEKDITLCIQYYKPKARMAISSGLAGEKSSRSDV